MTHDTLSGPELTSREHATTQAAILPKTASVEVHLELFNAHYSNKWDDDFQKHFPRLIAAWHAELETLRSSGVDNTATGSSREVQIVPKTCHQQRSNINESIILQLIHTNRLPCNGNH